MSGEGRQADRARAPTTSSDGRGPAVRRWSIRRAILMAAERPEGTIRIGSLFTAQVPPATVSRIYPICGAS